MLLFLATNLAVVLVLSIVLSGKLSSWLGLNRQGMGGLLLMAAVFGFGGSIISLLISKWVAKRSYGVQIIEQSPQ